MESSERPYIDCSGTDAQAHGEHKKLWRIQGDITRRESTLHSFLWYDSNGFNHINVYLLTVCRCVSNRFDFY
jgi:hypothetical protein